MDRLTPEQRRIVMQAVKTENTVPEIRVRKAAHKLGYRFLLHSKKLPGKPDLVFAKWKICIFVHGCFWHRHQGCKRASTPATNTLFWQDKFESNVKRDLRVTHELVSLGWRVVVIWECETSPPHQLEQKIIEIFEASQDMEKQ